MISNKVFCGALIFIFAICNLLSALEGFKLIQSTNINNNNNNIQNFEQDDPLDNTKNNLINNQHPSTTQLLSHSYSTEKFYSFGERITGDKMMGEAKDKLTFPSATDKELVLSFPINDKKAFKVSHIRIYVDQSTSNGTAYILDGGIDEHFITVKVKALQTMWFSYLAECYGY